MTLKELAAQPAPGQWMLDLCPNCGARAHFTEHHAHHVETHGLDCGPYEEYDEEWLTCGACGATTDAKELAEAQPDENACEACEHQDGTHEEHGRWLCDDCADSPEDIQEGD